MKRGRLRQTVGEGYTRWRKFERALVWRMAHRRTGGRGDRYSEVTDNFTLLVFGDSRKPPKYGRLFLELLPRNFYACTLQAWSQTQQQGTDGETACSLYVRVASKTHSCVSVENVF